MKKTYSTIDIMKLFFAICVVAIHTGIMRNQDSDMDYYIMHGLFRLAVPFFLICSGYFLGVKLYKEKSTNSGCVEIKKYIKRLIIPFVFWIIVGFPAQLYSNRRYPLILSIVKIIRSLIFYPWGALWYVLAVIVAILIIKPFYKKDKINYVVIIGGILYLFALICNNYYFIIEGTFLQKIVDIYIKCFISARNGLFVGIFFVSLGMLLAKKQSEGKSFTNKMLLPVLIISIVIFIIELMLLKGRKAIDDSSLYLSFIILIPTLFAFGLTNNKSLDTKILRNYSTGIFFMHAPIRDTVKLGAKILDINLNAYMLFGIVVLISVILLTILYKINNKYINKVIK